MSFFTFQRVAQGYANHRPYYHPLIMQKIRQQINLTDKFNHALDVGCGTGLSTLALKELAHQVSGVDGSEEMIAVAKAQGHDQIAYYHAPAEALPFNKQNKQNEQNEQNEQSEQLFDLITICGAINWIDRPRFFPEAKRVLKEQGWVIIYDNFITDRMTDQMTDQMRENAPYTEWYQTQFLSRYPKPPRDETPLTQSECETYGFHFVYEEVYTNELTLSTDEYIAFMLTQSNVIAAVDMGDEQFPEARAWLQKTLTPIMPERKGTFLFEGYIWYLQLI